MPSLPFTVCCTTQPRVVRALALLFACWLAVVMGARAQSVELDPFDLGRTDEGLVLDFAAHFSLPPSVEDALHKGTPLHFVAEAEVFRGRWYWRDARIASASRNWRLTWQPLARTYRVNFGALSQSYSELAEALAAVQNGGHWRIAEPIAPDDTSRYYVIFSYRLDTTLLPRPMQFGIGGSADWQLRADRTVMLPDVARLK